MAIYRQVQMSFWTDTKVVDDFTPEDKYFYLYLFTNPHTNLAGCYEISLKQMADETGYSQDTLERLIERMERAHKVIQYDRDTKELLIKKWHKYNWTKSADFRKALLKSIEGVKTKIFREFLTALYDGAETVPTLSLDTPETTVTVTVTDTVCNDIKELNNNIYTPLENSDITEPLKEKTKDWLQYKKERRESYKPTGLKSLLTQLEKAEKAHGATAVIDAIDLAMANGWKGIGLDRIKGSPEPEEEYKPTELTDEERRIYAASIKNLTGRERQGCRSG